MNPPEPDRAGWRESLQRIGESLSALTSNRFELFSLELQEEKLRLIKIIAWLGLALAVGIAGVLVVFMALALWLWNEAGYVGLIGLAVAALAAAVGIIWAISRKIETGPTVFSQTAAEFRKDAECLRSK